MALGQVGKQLVIVDVGSGSAIGYHALVTGTGEAIELTFVTQVVGDAGLASEVEDFVDSRAAGALGDEKTTQRALGA